MVQLLPPYGDIDNLLSGYRILAKATRINKRATSSTLFLPDQLKHLTPMFTLVSD
jgi:hypothetical protein